MRSLCLTLQDTSRNILMEELEVQEIPRVGETVLINSDTETDDTEIEYTVLEVYRAFIRDETDPGVIDERPGLVIATLALKSQNVSQLLLTERELFALQAIVRDREYALRRYPGSKVSNGFLRLNQYHAQASVRVQKKIEELGKRQAEKKE